VAADKENLLSFNKPKEVSATFNDGVPTKRASRATSKTARSFAEGARYGMVDSDDEDDTAILDKIEGATPMTKRRVIQEENIKKVKKLGTMETAFTIFKSFVCTGILYMPKNFKNSGWLFSGATIVASLIVTTYCCKLLLDVSDKVKLTSFPQIGLKLYGKPGKIAADIVLFSSQFGFLTAYVYFIAQ
jgi:solute carrier family 36 (proton-coupled amino acid transporter)